MVKFDLLTSGEPQFRSELKNDRGNFGIIFHELSNAAFRLALRYAGAEVAGVFTPKAGGRKSRGPAGRRFMQPQRKVRRL